MIVKKVWFSATWMSWLALSVRLLGFAVLLPLVLKNYSQPDVTVWLLFSAISSLQLIADMGFSQTFARTIAYGFAGGGINEQKDGQRSIPLPDEKRTSIDPVYLTDVVSTMIWVYRRLTLFAIFCLASLGSFAVAKPIASTSNPFYIWVAWVVVVAGVGMFVYGNSYSSYLIGANRIDLLKRWELLVNVCSLFTQILIVSIGSNLLILILSMQFWVITQVLINGQLVNRHSRVVGIIYKHTGRLKLLSTMWASAWRSGLGVLMSLGVSQGMFIVLANLLPAKESSSVLLSLRIVQTISQFSQAPFYSKLPLMNGYRVNNDMPQLSKIASISMNRSLWVYVLCVIFIGLIAPKFLIYIDSNTKFTTPLFWSVLIMAYFMERYGGMHIQIYSTTDKIVWHIANGITGTLWVVTFFILYPWLSAMAFPISMLLAYTLFYSWYAGSKSHSSLSGIDVISFEKTTTLGPAILLFGYAGISLVLLSN